MRELKFRAWLKNVGIMLSVYVLDQTGNAGRGTHFEKSKGYGEHGGQFVFNIDDAELMQYVGLKDKNGKEIYEGDILTYSDYSDTSHHRIYWDEKECRFMDERLEDGDSSTGYDGFEFVKDCKIIGNIHEHKHLLQ